MSAPNRATIGGEGFDVLEGRVEVDDAGPQHERAAEDRVRQECLAALVDSRQQLADSSWLRYASTCPAIAQSRQIARHIAERGDAEALTSAPRSPDVSASNWWR